MSFNQNSSHNKLLDHLFLLQDTFQASLSITSEYIKLIHSDIERVNIKKAILRDDKVKFEIETRKKNEDLSYKRRKLNNMYADQSDIIHLNVGGKYMSTRRSTLCKQTDSMLYTMFTTKTPLFTDKEGRYFIDRNPRLFSIILDMLRADSYAFPKVPLHDIESLEREMDYFLLLNSPNSIYAIGGGYEDKFNFSMRLNSIERYDISQNTWSVCSFLPSKFSNPFALSFPSHIFILDGFYDEKQVKSIEKWHPRSNTWGQPISIPLININLSIVRCDNYIYSISHNRTIHRIDPLDNSSNWVELSVTKNINISPNLPDHCSIITYKHSLYIIGGKLGYIPLCTFEKLDLISNKWSILSHLPTPRSSFAVVSNKDNIYVIGGCGQIGEINKVEKYDILTDKWTKMASLNFARMNHSAVSTAEHIFVCGGTGFYKEDSFSSCERYDFECDKWNMMSSMCTPRAGHACVVFQR